MGPAQTERIGAIPQRSTGRSEGTFDPPKDQQSTSAASASELLTYKQTRRKKFPDCLAAARTDVNKEGADPALSACPWAARGKKIPTVHTIATFIGKNL